jgi:hypothetical protein
MKMKHRSLTPTQKALTPTWKNLFVCLFNVPSTAKVIRARIQCGCSLMSYPGHTNMEEAISENTYVHITM